MPVGASRFAIIAYVPTAKIMASGHAGCKFNSHQFSTRFHKPLEISAGVSKPHYGGLNDETPIPFLDKYHRGFVRDAVRFGAV
jgi:hypothetical protein